MLAKPAAPWLRENAQSGVANPEDFTLAGGGGGFARSGSRRGIAGQRRAARLAALRVHVPCDTVDRLDTASGTRHRIIATFKASLTTRQATIA